MIKRFKWNRMRASELGMGYAFLLPAIIFLLFSIVISTVYAFYMSFFEWTLFDLGAKKTFVGLGNYIKIFSDKVFARSLTNTLTIVVVCLSFEMVIGFLIALTLWTFKKTLRLVQTIILLPMITAPVIVGLIWRYIYDPQFGILNYVLKKTMGLSNIAWLGTENLALPSVILVDIWQMTPFVVLILFGGMLSISEEWIEAARVDGAHFWQIVRLVILPSITPFITFVLLMRVMDLFKIFDTVYVLTNGGPGYATETLAIYTYKTGFSFYDMGYAMALSMVSLVIIASISLLYLMRRKISKDL